MNASPPSIPSGLPRPQQTLGPGGQKTLTLIPLSQVPKTEAKGALGASLAQTRHELHKLLMQRRILDQLHAINSHPALRAILPKGN